MIWVARHGRTEANAGGLLLGRADPVLDEVGQRQAAQIAQALPAGARVISSPLQRTRQTAQAIRSDVEIDERLIELDYGEFDLQPAKDIPAETWAAWRTDPGFRPPGGETFLELGERVASLLDDVASDAIDRDVVLVSHVSPIKAAMAWALGVGIEVSWRSFVGQASITSIAMSDRGPSLHSFNDRSHLDD